MTVLVVDVGTVHTVAADAAGVVLVDGAPWIPSAGHSGADALRLGRETADRDVRAVLTRVVEAAGTPDELVLTHPADWPPERVAELVAAADGLAPTIRTVLEPLAVAPAEGTVLVVDAGGGTCAVALVRDGTVLASASRPVDLDQRIVDRLAPSLRTPATSARDRQLLADAARAAKELLSRHDRADIVLPDHRAVRLTRAEFEELIGGDVDQVIALAAGVVGQARLDRVVLVGGASRVPLLARRLAEAAGRPVQADPEPETAVARGAVALVTRPVAARRPWLAAAALAVALLLVAAVVLLLPGQRTAGRAVAGGTPLAATPPPTLPPAVAGTELADGAAPTVTDGEFGEPVTFRHASGTELELVFDRIETLRSEAGRYGVAPPGYRWLFVGFRLTHVAGPEWRDPLASTAALDDRGQWLPVIGDGVSCAGADPPVATVPPGGTVTVCGVFPIPDRTTVAALAFGDRQAAVRVPTSVTAVQGAGPAPASIAGRLGGEPVTVTLGEDDLTATFDLVATPSAYLGDRRPAAGNRLVVLRAALTGYTDQRVYLRDDRGALTGPLPTGDLPDCPAPTGSTPYACLVYEVNADSPIAGVTVGEWVDGVAVTGADLANWPTWTP